MRITIAILVLLLVTITATVFTVKDSPPSENPTGETQITLSATEKEPATVWYPLSLTSIVTLHSIACQFAKTNCFRMDIVL